MLVHVSTAYANCNRQHIDEIIYQNLFRSEELLDAAQSMDASMLDSKTESLLSAFPNTYTFTKCLAESYLGSHATHLPLGNMINLSSFHKNISIFIAIIRPSIIGSAWREPIAVSKVE